MRAEYVVLIKKANQWSRRHPEHIEAFRTARIKGVAVVPLESYLDLELFLDPKNYWWTENSFMLAPLPAASAYLDILASDKVRINVYFRLPHVVHSYLICKERALSKYALYNAVTDTKLDLMLVKPSL